MEGITDQSQQKILPNSESLTLYETHLSAHSQILIWGGSSVPLNIVILQLYSIRAAIDAKESK